MFVLLILISSTFNCEFTTIMTVIIHICNYKDYINSFLVELYNLPLCFTQVITIKLNFVLLFNYCVLLLSI